MQPGLNVIWVLPDPARDATVIFVPPLPVLDRTYDALVAAGCELASTEDIHAG